MTVLDWLLLAASAVPAVVLTAVLYLRARCRRGRPWG